jgi:hypothetical protein
MEANNTRINIALLKEIMDQDRQLKSAVRDELGLDKSMLSRRLKGESALLAGELLEICARYKVDPMKLYVEKIFHEKG